MEAVNARLIDLQAGTYHNPATGEVIPILLAIQRGLISTDGDASHRDSVPMQFSMDTTSGHWASSGSLTDSKVAGSRRTETKDTLTRKVETKTIVDISSLPRRGMSGDSSLPRHGVSGDSSLPRHGMSGDSSLPRHGVSGDSSLPGHGLSGDSSLPRHGTSGDSSLPHHGVFDDSSLPQHGDSSLPRHGVSGDSSLPQHGLSGEHVTMTGSGTSVVTNGVKLEEAVQGMDELDNLIAKMRDSAGYTEDDDIEVRVTQRPEVDLHVKQPMTLKEAVDAGLIDKSTGLVTDPFSGQQLTLEDAVKAGIIDGKTSSVMNPSVGQLVSLEEALKLGIVDGKSGKVLDPTTRRGISIDEAIHSGVVVSHKPGVKKQEPLTLDKALSNGMMDTRTGMVTDPLTGQKITIGEAVAMGIIDGKASSVIDPSTGRSVSLDEALKLGIVDGKSGKVVNLATGKSISMSEAAQQRHRMTDVGAVRSDKLDVSSGLLAESATGRQVMLQQAVVTSELIDTTGRSTLTEGALDGVNGTISATAWHTSSKPGTSQSTAASAVTDVAEVSCDSSSQLLAVSNDAVHAITTAHCVALTDDLMLSVLQNETGDGGETTGTDVEQQPRDKSTPVATHDENHLMELELEGDDDAEAALQIVELNDLLKDKSHADTQQPKLSAASSMTLLEAVTSGLADSTSGLFEDPHTGKKMPLREAIELRLIATGKMLVTDTAKDETVSLPESVRRQIVDADFTTFVDTKASRQLSFTDAIREGFIREDDRIPTLSELAADGRYDPTTGTVVDPNTGQRISLLEAIESKLLGRQSVRLLDPATGNDISLAEAFERGILDPDTGILLDTYTGQTMNLVDSVNKAVLGMTTTCLSDAKPPARQQGPSVADKHMNLDESNISKLTGAADRKETPENIDEGSKTYSITDAIQDGIYDPKRNVVIDPASGRQMSLEEAVEIGLIDISRAMVRDPHTGQKVAFEVLVEMGLIDINTGMVRDSQGRHIPLEDAVLNGLMFENPPLTGPLTLLQLIDEGLFKVETSEFFDPISRELVSLREAVVRSLLDPQSIVVHEIGSSEVLGIQDAINVGVIDAESGYVRDNLSREVISLADALDRSIVLGKPLPIVTAIDIGLLNETTAKFLDPSCRKFFSLAAAIENGLIDSDSCFTDPATGRAISVSRAVSCGVLDPESACVTNLHTGDVMTLKEAITAAKLMHSSASKPPMSVDKAISLGHFNQSSNLFTDPHSKEELTLEAAVAAGYLDSNSTMSDSATGRRITVAQFLNEMQPKVGKSSLSLQEAVEKGYYNAADGTLVNPSTGTRMTLAEAVHSGVIEGSKNFIRVDGKEVSLQDAIQKGLIDPLSSEVAIPGMPVMSVSDAISCKVVIDDDEDKEHKVAGDDVDRKGDESRKKKLNMPLQEVLQMGLFIEDTGKVENPETHELLTVQEAFDSCLIDKDSVKFKHPAVGLLMSFDESVKSELVDPSTGDVMSPEGESLTLKEAVGEGLVITALTDKGLSLIDIVQQGVYEPVSGRLTHPFSGVEMTVQEGIETGLIDTKKTRVCDANQQEMSTDQAISQKLINTDTGRFEEPDSGEPLTLGEAITKNYLIEQKLTKLSIDEAVDRGLFDVRTGIFVDPVTGKHMKMMEAIKSGLLDPSQTLLTSPDGSRMLTLDEAIAAGMVDVNTGELIDTHTGQRMSFVEATDRGLVLDTYVPPMMSFTEANTKGLFDRRTGNFSHPVTGTRLNFEAAINTGLIDPEKCQLILPGPGELSTLAAAIDEDLVDDKFVNITEPTRKHTALLVDALSDDRLVPDQNQLQLDSSMQMKDTPPTGIAGASYGSDDAVISEVESEKRQMETVSSGPGIAGPSAAVDDSTDSKMTMVSSESGVRHGVLLCAVRGMSLSSLVNSNLFDRDTCSLLIPDSDTSITLSDALSRGIVDFSHVAVRSLVTGQVFDFHTACKNGLVDLKTGSVYYPATGSWLGLMDAIDQGIVFDGSDGQKTLQELVDQGIFDVTSAMFVHAPTKMTMNLQQSLESGLLNANKLLIMLPATREAFTLQYAIANGLADTQRELISSPLTGTQFRLVDLCSAGEIQTSPQLPAGSLTLKQVPLQGLLSAETRRVQHSVTGEWLTLAEALDSGVISSADTMVKDCRTGSLISLGAAIDAQMVDTRMTEMVNPLTGSRSSLFAALEHGLGLSVQEAISAGLFNGETGRFVNPDTTEELTLSEAIAAGLIDPTTSFMTDADTGLPVSLGEALSRGMVDSSTGDVINTWTGTRLGLTEAVHTGLILSDITQQKFDGGQMAGVVGGTCVPTLTPGDGAVDRKQAVSSRISPTSNILQPSTGTDGISDLPKTSEDLRFKQTKDDVSQRHSGKHHSLTFEEAVSAGLADEDTGLVTDPATGVRMTINEAVRSGVINSEESVITDPATGKQLLLADALSQGIIDEQSSKKITSEVRSRMGLGTPNKGPLQKKMTIREAVAAGLIEPTTGHVTDPRTGNTLTLQEAVESGIIDGQGTKVRDPESGRMLPLMQALNTDLVDFNSNQVIDSDSGTSVFLMMAVDPVVVSEHKHQEQHLSTDERPGDDVTSMKAEMTLNDAVNSGSLDSSTGLITDALTGQQMTLVDAEKAGIIDSKASSIVSPSTGQMVSSEGLRLDIVDGKQGKVVDRTTGRVVGLEEASSIRENVDNPPVLGLEMSALPVAVSMSAGNKDDVKHSPLTLKAALEEDVFDVNTGTVCDPKTGMIKSLADAVRDGLIDPLNTIILDPSSETACTLQDAVNSGLILPDTGMVYDKSSGRLMTFADAIKSGFLDLEAKPSSRNQPLISLEDAISSGLFDSHTGTFLDTSTNERVPFREAIGKMVDVSGIEVRHPKTNRMLSLEEAITDGLINAETGYFNAATGTPISLQQAMMLGYVMGWMARELTIDVSAAGCDQSLAGLMQIGLLDADTGLVYDSAAGKKISIEDAVKRGIIDGNTLCMYDTDSGRMLSVEECLSKGLINKSTGRITDPSSRQERTIADIVAVSHTVEEAVVPSEFGDDMTRVKRKQIVDGAMRSGLMDSSTGLITDPLSGQRMTLVEAVKTGIIDSEASNVVDPSGRMASLSEGLRLDIVDGKSGEVLDRTTGRVVGLDEAVVPSERGDDVSKVKKQTTLDNADVSVSGYDVQQSGLLQLSAASITKASLETPAAVSATPTKDLSGQSIIAASSQLKVKQVHDRCC